MRNLKGINRTTIRLFSKILQGVGQEPLNGSRRKGGIKVHKMMVAFRGVTVFLRKTMARVNDRKFLYLLQLKPES